MNRDIILSFVNYGWIDKCGRYYNKWNKNLNGGYDMSKGKIVTLITDKLQKDYDFSTGNIRKIGNDIKYLNNPLK